jgi:MFS transporter, ACS family, glucarate transporter
MSSSPPHGRPTRTRYLVLTFLCTLSLLTYLDRICISRVQEDIKRDLHFSDLQMGLVFAAFLWGYTLFEVPGGRMGDRWGSRRVLTRIVVWWSVFTALTGCVQLFSWYGGEWDLTLFTVRIVFDSFLLMLLVRFLFGCGEAGAYPNAARVVGAWFPYRERAFTQGAIWMSARLGGALAPIVIGHLTRAVGWRWAFVVLGLIGVVWAGLFAWWFRDRPEEQPACNDLEREQIRAGAHSWQAGEADHAHAPVPWRQVLTSPTIWAMCLAAACVSFAWYFYPTWQPRFLKDVHGMSPAETEVAIGLPFLFGALGCFLGGRLSDRLVQGPLGRRWGRSLIGVVGFGGAASCFLAAGFVRDYTLAVVLLCAASLINDFAIPVIWTVPADIAGRNAGAVAGFMNMLGGVGGMLTPVLIPVVLGGKPEDWTRERWQVVFVILASAWFVGAVAWLGIDARRKLFADQAAL